MLKVYSLNKIEARTNSSKQTFSEEKNDFRRLEVTENRTAIRITKNYIFGITSIIHARIILVIIVSIIPTTHYSTQVSTI